jgi:sec-independent protein translocase protein TatA
MWRKILERVVPRIFLNEVRYVIMIENLFRPTHLLLVLAIAVLVFGPRNLPQIGKGLGQAIRGFKESLKEGEEQK